MTSIKARRSFIESTDSGSDMNPDLSAVIEDTLVKMSQAINIVTDVEPSLTCSGDQGNLDETSAHEDSSILEHHQDSPGIKYDPNDPITISEIIYDKDSDEFRYIVTRDYFRLWDNRNGIYHEATRI